MKKQLLSYALKTFLFLTLVVPKLSIGQVAGGTYTVPGSYASIAAAVTSLNAAGISGAVTINVAAGNTETNTSAAGITLGSAALNATLNSTNTLTIQKDPSTSGANPRITAFATASTATPATTASALDGIFRIAGADYVTIDGIDLADNAANTTAATAMEFGYGLLKLSANDGAQNNTIKNCIITLTRANATAGAGVAGDGSMGIWVANTLTTNNTALTVTNVSGTNSNNTFISNTIQQCHTGIMLFGPNDATAPYSFYDQNNSIGGAPGAGTGNIIRNFGGGGAQASAGIRMYYQNNLNINNNNINNNNGSGVNNTSTLRGIFLQTALNANVTVRLNTITIKGGGTTSQLAAIESTTGGTGTNNTLNISNNTITGCTYTTATSGVFYGIYHATSAAFNLKMNGNIFNNNSTNAASGTWASVWNSAAIINSISMDSNTNDISTTMFTAASTSATVYYGPYNTGGAATAVFTMNYNTVTGTTNSGVTFNGATGGTGPQYFLYNTASMLGDSTIGNTINNVSLKNTSTWYFIFHNAGLRENGKRNFRNNTISNITRTAGTGTTYGYYTTGAGTLPGTHVITVSGNTFTNFSNNNGTTYAMWFLDGGSSPYPVKYVFNNEVNNVTNTSTFYGLYVSNIGNGTSGVRSQVYNNNVRDITTSTTIYGFYVATATAVDAYQNQLYNVTSTGGTIYSFYISTVNSTANFYRNSLREITTGSTTGFVSGFYLVGGTTTNIYNNYVGNLSATASTSNTAANGIHIISTANANLYNNTVYLNFANSSGSSFGTSCIWVTSATPILRMQNNIFYSNVNPGPTGGACAVFRYSVAPGASYSSLSNNNCFFNNGAGGTKPLYCEGATATVTNALSTIAAYKAFMSTKDQSSISEDVGPLFLSTTSSSTNFLRMGTGVATQTESGGANLSSIFSNDYDGDARTGTAGYVGTGSAYDIGADEFDGIPSDQTAPNISHTGLGVTCSTSDRTFNVTITDATGVPLDPASTVKPRVYFKKGIAGTYTSTPATFVSGDAKTGVWSFNIEAAGMSGLALYDTVYYYLVAQDSAVSNSAGANPSSGAVLSDVNTVTTDPTSPYSYVISAQLSGVINVGSGQTFATLTAAAAAYSNSCISGAVTYNLTDAAYNSTTGEVFPITFTSNGTVSAANYLTIKPASGVTPIIRTGNKSGFVLSGADYMVIDGSNTVGGTTKDLTIHTDTFSVNICGVLMANPSANPATNNMVKNCVVRGPSNRALNAASIWSCGIAVSGPTFTGSGSNNDSNTIKNNRIYNYFMGITVKGTATTGMVRGTIIEDNTIIDSIDYVGIELQQTISPIIRRNEIGASNSVSTYVAGIYVSPSINDNALIYQNTIRKVNNFSTGGWYAYGIYLGAPFTASAGHHVYNNLIYDMRTANYSINSVFNAHGIYVAGNNAKIYNNSIRFYGPVTVGTAAGSSYCVYIESSRTGINFENNVLENKTEFGVSGSFAVALYCSPGVNFTAGGSCNRNIYYAANSTSNAFTTANLMYNNTTPTPTRINTLALIQAATLQDANSSVDDPLYNPLPSLKMDPSSYARNNASVVSTPAVTTDFDGATRSVSTPSIGAYETFNDLTGPRYSFANLVNPTTLGNVSVTGISITDPSGVDMSVGNKPRLYYRKNSEANAFVGNTSSDNGWKYVEPTNAASPFSFTMDVSLLSSALVPNDTIKYFFTAQDSLSKVSISQGAYTTTTQASISALSGADFPIVGSTIKQIQIVLPPMFGDYTIGTGADYNSVTAAINDINLRGVSAAVNLKVQNSYRVSNEPSFPITIGVLNGASAVNTITLKPDVGATPTIEGSFAGAIIKLAGTRYFTIDGSNNGTNSRDLTIRNNIRATNGATAIWISSLGTGAGATRDIVKNCIISTNHLNGTANFNTFGIYVGNNATLPTTTVTSNPGIDNDTLSFINNQIVKSHYGIFVNGTEGTTSMSDSIVVMNNDIGRDSIGFMGVFLQQVNKALVKGNEVHNIATIALNPIGINISTLSKNIDILKNKVYDLNYTGTGGYGAKGINIANAEDTSNINIINNVIYNINGDGYTATTPNDAPTGIMLTTATGGINIYNNSVSLSAIRAGYNGTTITAAVMLQSAVVGPINMVNNVLVNTYDNTTVTTDKNTAVYNLTATSVFGTMDYNHYFVSGPQALLGFFNADLSDLASYQGSFGGNVNSKDSNPGFNTSTILVLNLGSSALNTGTPLALVTEDYLGTTRSATNPSRGAFEVGGDAAAPTIVFTNSSNRQLSGSTLAFTGIAAITDYSGVDTTAGTAPRMYYKKFSDANTYVGNSSTDNGWKYVETSSTSTPFSFTMDLSTLFGGVYAIGDTIQYFFSAKDLTPAGNSGISPSLLTTPATSPSLVASNFPVYGTIPRFNLVDVPMAGNYNIGAGQTAPNYATINAAVNDLSLRGVNAPVTLSLLDASYSLATGETFPISVPAIDGSSTTNTVTLMPATGVTANITAAANTATIKFLGTKNFIIDGSNNGTTSRNLTIANTNIRTLGVGNTVAIWFASQGAGLGCSRDIVKNTIIENPYFYNGSNLTSFGILVGDNTNISSSAAGIDNDTLSFINNKVTKANTAILVRGTPASMSDSILIANNDLGSDSLYNYGMWIEQVRYSQITGNSVHNLNTASSLPMGIYLNTGDSNIILSKNAIYDIHTTGTLAGGKGIYVNTGVALSNIDIINNVIHSIDGFGYINSSLGYANSGINFGPVATGGVRVYNNSINLNGNYAGYNGTSVTAPIVVQANVVGPLDIRNNVLTNTYDNTTVTTDVNCAIYSAAANTVFSNVDFNAYYTAGPQASIGFLTTAQTTLAGMQTAFGGNTNSTITNPNLNSNTILAPQAGSVVLATGTPLAAVTEDFLGNIRSVTTPSKGAYEIGGDYAGPSFTFTSLANASTTSSRTLNVTLTDATGVPTSGAGLPMAYYKINAAGTWTGSQGAHVSGNNYQFTIGGGTVNNDTTFYYLVAQDVLGNVSANVFNGAGALTATPPATASAPTNPLSYRTLPSVSGNYLVGIGQTYTSLTDTTNGFFKFVNSSAVEGNVTVEITSDVTELGLVELNDFGSAYNMTITPQNATITTLRGYNRPTHMIGIKATNVTFDGSVAGSGKYLRMIVFNTTPASCNAAIRISSTNNFVCKNVIFEGNSSVNPLFNIFATTPDNFNPKIMSCIFQDTVSSAPPVIGITSTSKTVRGLTVGGFNTGEGNEFRNITTNAVNLSGTTDSVKVVGNSIYRTTTTTTAPTYINYSGTAIGSVVIANNHFGGSDATRGGNALNIITTTSASTMINVSAGNNAVHHIYGNTISNLGSVSGALVGINVSGTTRAYIYQNTIGGGATVSDTIRNGADNGMITSSTSDSVRIYNNTISNVAYYKASGDRTAGIYCTIGFYHITNNTIRDFKSNGTATGVSTLYPLAGIHVTSSSLQRTTGMNIIKGNSIYNFTQINPGAASYVTVGIHMGGSSNATVDGNRIYGFACNGVGVGASAPALFGITAYSTADLDIINNQISISNNSSSFIKAIEINSTDTNNIYNNSIYVGGTSSVATNSYGIYRTGSSTTNKITIVNNLIYNGRVRATGTSGNHYAIGTSTGANLGGGLFTVSNNAYLDSNSVASFDTAGACNYAGWATKTRDVSNFYSTDAYPSTVFANVANADLTHAMVIANDSGASVAATSIFGGALLDFAGVTRSATPDIGALEFTPITNATLNLTAFLQGLYLGGGVMTSSPFNYDGVSSPTVADTITVELYNPDYTLAYSVRDTLSTTGQASITFPGSAVGNKYYVVIKHRSSLETWSSDSILIGSTTSYDFSSGSGQAYFDGGPNMPLVDDGTGIFLIYSGDITQDGAVDFNDYPDLDSENLLGTYPAYLATDLNADGITDFNDYPLLDANNLLGSLIQRPY